MEKILIGLYVPAVQKHFDLFVPSKLSIRELTELLSTGVDDLSNGGFSRTGSEMLCMKEPDMLLQPDKNLYDYGVEDGAQFIML